jgi:hypothetical protein
MPSAGIREAFSAHHAVAGHHREIGHERQLEPAPEREPRDLGHRDLRVSQERVVEVERLPVDEQPAALAGAAHVPRLGGPLAVPGVGVVHVRAGAEDPAGASQHHHLHRVVEGEIVEEGAELLAHRRVVRVLPRRVVQRDAGDARLVIAFDQNSTLAH